MKQPDTPHNEQSRLEALRSYDILDSLSESEYDDIVAVAHEICQTKIAVISFVDEKRQWFKSTIGLNIKETSRDISFCGHTINQPNDIFVVADARLDERFYDNPLVTGDPNIVFYAGVPLIDENSFALGTLCVIDSSPKTLSENQKNALQLLARNVVSLLRSKKKSLELSNEKTFLLEAINYSSPFFLMIDFNSTIIEFGHNYSRSITEIRKGKLLSDYFIWESEFNTEKLLASNFYENKLLFYKTIDGRQRYKCSIKKYYEDKIILFSTPVINSLQPIANYNLNINSFPKQDYIAEYLFLHQAATKGLEDAKKLADSLKEKNKLLEFSKSSLIKVNATLEEKVNERTKKIKNLALFPEQNPNPVFELDYEKKVINYANPASKSTFYINQDFSFEQLSEKICLTDEVLQSKKTYKIEIELLKDVYEIVVFFIKKSSIIRVYFHRITEIKNFQNELKEKNLELQDTLKQIVNLQDEVIKKEKLATLGLLISGIAHEINTPLGAIKASNENLIHYIENVFLDQLPKTSSTNLTDIIELYKLNKNKNSYSSTIEERINVKKIENQLKKEYCDISNPLFYAKIIFDFGFTDLDPCFNKFLTHKNNFQVFNFASNLNLVGKSLNTISIAIDKASKVVSSLNTFSHGNINGSLAEFNLKSSFESVLNILWNKIKQGSKVKINIPNEILVFGNQEELAQVWTNIINNALQASNYKCKIEISYLAEDGYHFINIKNDGPEIPKEIIGNIFDEFFTTKKAGEGTGLGLNIVKKIVKKNKGTIECKSNPNETKFIISIPIQHE